MFTPAWLAIVSLVISSFATPTQSASGARALLQRAVDAMGGEALKHITSIEVETRGHAYLIEQSERPEGPFVMVYEQGRQLRDFAGRRTRTETQQASVQSAPWSPAEVVVTAGDAAAFVRSDRMTPASQRNLESARRALDLGPERVLFTALEASDLRIEPDVKRRGMMQRVVSFGRLGGRVRILLNPYNFLPTGVEVVARDDTFDMWGVTTQSSYFSYWNLEPGGIRYPRQVDVFWNGVTASSTSVTKLTINAPVDENAVTIPGDVRAAFAAAAPGGFSARVLDAAQAREIAPNVVQLPGAWYASLVRQSDGVVVIEAPVSSGYSAQVLAEAARRYPGVPVKAVVTTSDAWPHIGGVREYAARGIPIVALDLNRPILERLLAAPYGESPDLLARAPKPAKVTWIDGKTAIGTGDSRLEVYPIRGENGERMLMVYLPAHQLLYSSDEIQKQRSGDYFMPQFLLEMRDAIRREQLNVQRVFGMHLAVTPWTEIEDVISKASSGPSAPSSR